MVSGHSMGSASKPAPNQAQGAEYGLPTSQIKACGGAVTVQVPAELADRFNTAVNKHADSGEGVASNIDGDTHKSGFEPLADRARNLTEVAQEKMRTEGKGETCSPDVGFPAREAEDKRGPYGQPPGQL